MEWLDHLWKTAQFWKGYEGPLSTAGAYALGMALYGILVWKLLGRLAARHPFGELRGDGGRWRKLGRFARLTLVFPLLATIYLAFLASALFILAKNQSAQQILLVSISLIGGIRVAAWLHEEAARDMAKIVPLGLLGFILVDPGIIQLDVAWSRFAEAPAMAPVVARYFLILVAIEVVAQSVLEIVRRAYRVRLKLQPPTPLRPLPAKPVTRRELEQELREK